MTPDVFGDRAQHRCPHGAIHTCPLYIASHVGDGLGCVDDLARPCLVSRGRMNFHREVHRVIRARFGRFAIRAAKEGSK